MTNKPMASINLAQLCFKESGLLFNEFENIFMDIFSKKSKTLELLKSKVEELRSARYSTDNVKVVVRNTAHPGAVIKYRRQIEKISKSQSSFVMNFFPNQDKAMMTAFKASK